MDRCRRGSRCRVLLVSAWVVLLSTWAGAGEGGFLGEERQGAFLARLEERGRQVRTLLVQFVQERRVPGLAEPLVSRGWMAFARPRRLHWEWWEPVRHLVVLNGGRVARFAVEGNRATRLRGEGDRAIAVIAGEIIGWMEGRYRAARGFALRVHEGEPPFIVLLPRRGAGARFLRRIEIRFGELPRVRRIEMEGVEGDTTTIRFLDEQRNVPLDERLFSLEDPAWLGPPGGGREAGRGD